MKTKIALVILTIKFLSTAGYSQVTKQLDSTIYAAQPIGTSATAIDNNGNTYLSYYDELVSDQIFIKINSCGQKVWQVTGPAYKFSNALKIDNNDNPILVCDTFPYNSTSQKMYRFDKNNGNILTQKKLYPNSLYIRVSDIVFDVNNNIILLGYNESNYTGIIVKYSTNFNLLWTKVGSYNQFIKGVILNNKIYCFADQGNLAYRQIIGLNLTTGAQVLQINGNTAQTNGMSDFDIYNSKLFISAQAQILSSDTLGNISTFVSISGANNQKIISNSSGVYVNYDSASTYKNVHRFDYLGNQLKKINLQVLSIYSDGAFFRYANSKLFIVGQHKNLPSFEKEINILDTLLNVQSIKVDTNNSPNNHINKWLRFNVNNSGEYLLMGNSCESGIGGCSVLKIYSSCLVTGTKEQFKPNTFNVYPNPAAGNLNINGLDKKQSIIYLINMFGEVIRTIETDNKEFISINVENLSSGVYFLKMNDKCTKFIKE